MPDGTYTKAEVVAKIRATQPKSAGFSDDQIIDRLIKKAPEFAQKITDYSTEPTKPAQKQQDLPMFQQQYEATMKVGQAKPVTTEVDDFTAIQKKKEKARVLSSGNIVSGFNAYTPGAGEQYQKNLAEAQKLDAEGSKDLEKFNKTFNSSPLYTGLVADSEKNLENFRSKDIEGFDFVDQQRLREYVRTKVPQAANTGFETYLMNKLSGNLSYKMDEPKIMKKAAEIAKQKKISLPDNWMNIDKEYSKKAKDVSDNVSKQFDAVASQAETETMQLNNAYKTTAESITNKYKNPEFQKNFASEEELMQAYKQESSASFDEYTKQFSNSKRKYNQLSQKLQSDYEKALSTLNVSGEKDAKKVADLLKEAVTSIHDDKNAVKYAMSGFVPTSGIPNAVTRGALTFVRGLPGWANSMVSYFDMYSDSQVATSFKDFTANLSKRFENPNIKIEKASDLLDINKLASFTGDQLSRMAPGLVTAGLVAGATGGVGIPAIIPTLAAGTVGWLDQVMQATGDNYNALIEQGLDPEEAKKRANRTYGGYLAAYPLTVIGMGGILGKYGTGSMIKRYLTGVASEGITEPIEEVIQQEQDEAIIQNRKMDFGKMADLNNVYKTTLNVLPTIGLMGIPGAVRESSAAGEGFLPEWVSRVANAPVQSFSRNILMNGLYANQAAIESMRHNGMITEEGSIQMKDKMAEIKTDMDAAKTAGLNKKQQSTYAGLMANVRTMEQSAAEVAQQDMDATAKEEAVNKANKRLENSKQAAADFLKTKNGNYAEVYDKDGDRYIVSHDELSEMLDDGSFTQDVKKGDARVQLFYDKKAGDLLGDVSKKLLSLNKDYSSGIREYNKSEQNTNALRARLGLPAQPTSSTTIDGLIGQKGKFTLSRFPARITTEGTLAVQNGKLVIEEDGGAITELGNASEFTGVAPSFIGMEFTPPKYTGPKMTQAEAKLPSLLAMYAGKIDPKTLVSLLGDMISDIKKPQLTKLVNAFDNAYQRKQQQKAINESLPKPQKLINVEPTEVGLDVDGVDVANTIAMVGDRNANTLTAKMLRIFSKPFISNSIDLDELHESSEEFRARVEEVRGQKQGQYNQEFSNPENIPAVMVDGKIIDGMGRLAQLYVNGQKTATVFENTKIEQDATQASEREIEEGAEPSRVSEYQGAEEAGTQAETVQTSPSDRPVSSKGKIRIKTTPAFGKFTRENIDKLFNITGLSKMQRKVINDARKVFDAIDKLVSKGKIPLSIHVHSQSSFERAVIEAGGKREDAVARGFYMASDGSIHLNIDNVASDTMLHEGFHPILDFLEANNPKVINDLFQQLLSIPEASGIVLQAVGSYRESGSITQEKEAITDFVAGVADGRIVLNPSNFQKIKAFILDLLSKIGLGEGSTLMDVNTELDLIKLAEFVTEKFAGGEAITKNELSEFMKKDSDYVASNGRPISNRQAQFSLGNDFKDKKTKTTFTYIKNNDQFESLKKAGYITEDKVLDDFIGKRMMLHSPDNAFTGIISKNGKILVEGKGGVFYPIRFHEDGYFWASTDNAANSMAKTLNEMIESNGGKIYLALVSAPANKLLSSTTASNGVVEFFTRFSKDNIPGLSQESVIDQMIAAAAVVVEQKVKKQDNDGNDVFDKNGNQVYVLKNVGLGINIPKSKMVKGKSVPITIDAVRKIIAEKLSPQNSTFADRKLFALKLISNIAASIKKTNAEQYLGEFFTKGILNEAYKQQGKIENRYNLSAANITQSLSDMLSEPMLKNSNTGEVYAVLEIEGKVEPVKSDQHESYPMAIRSQVGNKTTLHILQERDKWEDRFADPETGRAVEEKRKLNVFPTSGVSATGLMLLEKTQEGPAFQSQKAPNGKPSNLNPSQYEQVRTPAFKKWFGDWENDPTNASKVVDENGEPRVMYHGTNTKEDFDTFKETDYIFFAKDAEFASEYARAMNGRVIPVFISAKKIFDPTEMTESEENDIFDIIEKEELDSGANEDKAYDTAYQTIKRLTNKVEDNWLIAESDQIKKYIKSKGYDALAVRETGAENIAVITQNQIKSATANVGAFSTEDNRIQFQKKAQIGVEKQSGTTQVATTTGSYTKAAKIAEKLGAKSILDYGAGLGLGSDAIRSVIDNVESFEPNAERWQGSSPVTYTNTSDINKKYDSVINLNVLNVVPKDIRDAIVMDIFDKLNVGGNAIISTRKWSGDVNQAKNYVKGPEEKSVIIKRKSGGKEVDVYQKGFDGNELVDYISDILGDAATVTKDNSFGAAGVIINKKSDISEPQFQKARGKEFLRTGPQAMANNVKIGGEDMSFVLDYVSTPKNILSLIQSTKKPNQFFNFNRDVRKPVATQIQNDLDFWKNELASKTPLNKEGDISTVKTNLITKYQDRVDALQTALNIWENNAFSLSDISINGVVQDTNKVRAQFQYAAPTKSSYETVDKSALGRILGDSERAKAIKRNLAKGIPIWQQWFTTFKKFGESITESNDYKVGYINKEVRKANKYVDQTISALKKSAKEGTPVSDKDVTAFMEGDKTALNNYPPYVAIAVTNMRMHIDALTDTLITFGAITDPDEIALFRSNKGKYFGRYYDLFINGKNDISLENIKDRLKNVDQSVIDAAKNVIRTELRKSVTRQNVGKTQDEIDTILERRVTDQIERILTGRENNYVKTPTKGSVNMRVLTERMDIKPEIRALMGEVANPLVRYYSTIKKMSDLAAGVRYLNEFRTEGLGKFLFEENDPNRPDGANFEISTENNPNLQPLGGLWTYKEFYDELTKNLEPESLNRFDQIAGKAFAASKYLKTVANPGTHAKNVISNVFIMINNGYMGVDLFNAIATLSTDPKFREQLLETLTESNVLSNNIGLQEINSFIKQNDDLDKIIADKFSDKSKIKYSYEKVKGWLSGAYQFEDEIFKMLAFMVEAERYSNDIYGVTYKNLASSKKAEVDKLMSKRIKNVMPTFSRVPAFVKAANKYLYLGAFMAYTAESVRIEKNNFMIAIKELSDPRTRATGGKRLAGMATLNYMFWSKTAGAGAAVGALATGAFTYGYSALQALMDDEDEQVKEQMSQREKDIRLWVREFSQSSDLASIKITDKGISYVDIGAYHPFGYRHKILNRFDQLVRDEEEGVVMDAARALGSGLDPWIQPDFTVKAFLDALNNTDKYNKEISNSNDPSWKKTIDQSSYFIKESFSPGMVNNMIRAYKADQKGEPEKVKKSFQDILVREDEIEFTKSFYYKFKNEWDTKFSQANKYYNDAVSAGDSPEAIQEAFNKSVDTKKRIIDDVVKYYQSAIRMGASAEEMAAIVEKMAPTNKIANMIKGDFKYTDYSDYVQPRD